MQRALARHQAGEARVIPIILRQIDWHGAPFGTLQALPTDAKPITSWTNRDEACANVTTGVRSAIEAMLRPTLPKDGGAWEGWAVWPGAQATERRTYYDIQLQG